MDDEFFSDEEDGLGTVSDEIESKSGRSVPSSVTGSQTAGGSEFLNETGSIGSASRASISTGKTIVIHSDGTFEHR